MGGNIHQVWEHDSIFERASNPDQVQRVLVDIDLLCKGGCVVRAQVPASIRSDADSKVSDTDFHACMADNVGDGCYDAWVDLRGVKIGCIVLVVQGDQEDVRNAR